MKDYRYYLKEILITEEDLQNRIAELGSQISVDYKDCEDLLLVCILRGAVVFLTDLSRQLQSRMPWISWRFHPMALAAGIPPG